MSVGGRNEYLLYTLLTACCIVVTYSLKSNGVLPHFGGVTVHIENIFVAVALPLRPSFFIFHHLMSAVISSNFTKSSSCAQIVVFNNVFLMLVVVLLPVVSETILVILFA